MLSSLGKKSLLSATVKSLNVASYEPRMEAIWISAKHKNRFQHKFSINTDETKPAGVCGGKQLDGNLNRGSSKRMFDLIDYTPQGF